MDGGAFTSGNNAVMCEGMMATQKERQLKQCLLSKESCLEGPQTRQFFPEGWLQTVVRTVVLLFNFQESRAMNIKATRGRYEIHYCTTLNNANSNNI